MNKILITSKDGTHTIYDKEIDEHYHSVFWAYTESQHVFINNGLNYSGKNPLNVLEIGFGTGLNAFLAMVEGQKNNRIIFYEAIELYPLVPELTRNLNYVELIAPSFSSLFFEMHNCEWNKQIAITKSFNLKKILGDALEIEFTNIYDVVFFDAFSPDKQPEMWDGRLFEKIYKAMNTGGVLTTYCAKGIVKRALKEIGFKVEVLPGPPGKRHVIRAVKQ
jgi:tRNA U34 5-methylaminomethyl-2-thiouridine-forming methyltransferase MnmC